MMIGVFLCLVIVAKVDCYRGSAVVDDLLYENPKK
jgi:hypothetical protein